MAKFEVGTRVILKSGSPVMTYAGEVGSCTGDDWALCQWFLDNKCFEQAFPFESLEEYKPLSLAEQAKIIQHML